MDKLQWQALEYEEKERSRDWFWALGIIVVASSLAAIIYSNYFFAVLIILSGILLGFFAVKKPELVVYELNKKGLKIRDRLYPYENIHSFWVQWGTLARDAGERNLKPIFFIRLERLVLPHMSIPIDNSIANEIKAIMTESNIPEEEMSEHPSQHIMESLGF